MAERLIVIDWMWLDQALLCEVVPEWQLKWLPEVDGKVNLRVGCDDFTVQSVTRELDDPVPTVTIEVTQ